MYKSHLSLKGVIIVQFPKSVPVIVNLDLTLNFVTLKWFPNLVGFLNVSVG